MPLIIVAMIIIVVGIFYMVTRDAPNPPISANIATSTSVVPVNTSTPIANTPVIPTGTPTIPPETPTPALTPTPTFMLSCVAIVDCDGKIPIYSLGLKVVPTADMPGYTCLPAGVLTLQPGDAIPATLIAPGDQVVWADRVVMQSAAVCRPANPHKGITIVNTGSQPTTEECERPGNNKNKEKPCKDKNRK